MAMNKLINHLEQKPVNSLYLSLFRLFICFHLFKKVIVFLSSGDILYGRNSFVSTAPGHYLFGFPITFWQDNYKLLTFGYIILIVFFLFGIGRYLTAILLYFMVRLIQELNGLILNGGDNLLSFVMLYLSFANSYDYFVLSPIKFNSQRIRRFANFTTNLAVFSIVFHLCLIYFFSAIGKTNTSEWYKGVALYYTLMNERFKGTAWNETLAMNGYFVTIGTYFTLLFEFLFPFFIWQRRWRNVLVLSGIALHAGIYVLMMIHDFEILFIAIYGFLFSDKELCLYKKLISQWAIFKYIKRPAEQQTTVI